MYITKGTAIVYRSLLNKLIIHRYELQSDLDRLLALNDTIHFKHIIKLTKAELEKLDKRIAKKQSQLNL